MSRDNQSFKIFQRLLKRKILVKIKKEKRYLFTKLYVKFSMIRTQRLNFSSSYKKMLMQLQLYFEVFKFLHHKYKFLALNLDYEHSGNPPKNSH